MTTLPTHLDRQLARTVALTDRFKQRTAAVAPLKHFGAVIDFAARALFWAWRNRRYLTLVKLTNMALINLQFLAKTEHVLGRPYKMKIESTNICNTHCQLCPTGIGLEGRSKGKMTLEQFKQLIDRLRWHLLALDLSMWGDPLIVPEIYDMIRHAHNRGVWTYISSNLHAFKPNKGQAEQLVQSGLDMLTCSLHGAAQATFEIYQPGKDFNTAVDKIRHLVDVRKRLGSKTPEVQLNFVVTKHNEHEIDTFTKLARELGCKPVFSTASMNLRFLSQDKNLTPLGLAPDVLRRKQVQHVRDWLPRNEEYALAPYREIAQDQPTDEQMDYNGHKVFNCSWPWRQSVINWDGEVVTCCGSFDPAEDMGNVFTQPFARIWNSQKYRLSRRSFKRKLNDQQTKNNPCAQCPGYML